MSRACSLACISRNVDLHTHTRSLATLCTRTRAAANADTSLSLSLSLGVGGSAGVLDPRNTDNALCALSLRERAYVYVYIYTYASSCPRSEPVGKMFYRENIYRTAARTLKPCACVYEFGECSNGAIGVIRKRYFTRKARLRDFWRGNAVG